MAANKKQKLKLLYIYKMLQEESDAEHGLDAPRIIEKLEEEGISAERKGIYRDLDTLRQFGLTINRTRKGQRGSYLERDGLDLAELTMLVDAVQSSRFLSKQTADRLVKHVRNLANIYDRESLKGRVHVDGRVKNQSDSVFHNVDRLHEIMNTPAKSRKKVCFQYQRFNNKLEKQAAHDGAEYVVTPVHVVFTDGFYYLIAWSDEHNDFRHYRIDRMRLIQESSESVTRNSEIAAYKYEDHAIGMFGMFAGKEKTVKLRAEAEDIDILADRFGWDEAVKARSKANKDGSITMSVMVAPSPQFYGWVAGMDGKVTIEGSKAVLDDYNAWLKKLAR